ncbi:MAG: T9SS type A sorting domain-containing protein [Fibrobacterales bacterium]
MLLLLLLIGTSYSKDLHWQNISMPGAAVSSLLTDGKELYASTRERLKKWDTSTQQWNDDLTLTEPGHYRHMIQADTFSVIATDRGVLYRKSTGAWEPIASPISTAGSVRGIHYNKNTLYISSTKSIYSTQNWGVTWEHHSVPPSNSINIGASVIHNDTLWVGHEYLGKLYLMDLQTNSWDSTQLFRYLGQGVTSLVFKNDSLVIGTKEEGTMILRPPYTEALQYSYASMYADYIEKIIVENDRLYVINHFGDFEDKSGIYTSSPGGSWTDITGNLPKKTLSSMTFFMGSLWVSDIYTGVHRLDGDTWTSVNAGLNELIYDKATLFNNDLYVSVYGGEIFRSKGLTNNWTPVPINLKTHRPSYALESTTAGVWYGVLSDGIFFTDGDSLVNVSNNIDEEHISISGISILNDEFYIGARGSQIGVSILKKNGDSWLSISDDIDSNFTRSITLLEQTSNYLYVCEVSERLSIYDKALKTWEHLTTPSFPSFLHVESDPFILGAGKELFISNDSAKSWQPVANTPDEYYNNILQINDTFYLGTYKGIYMWDRKNAHFELIGLENKYITTLLEKDSNLIALTTAGIFSAHLSGSVPITDKSSAAHRSSSTEDLSNSISKESSSENNYSAHAQTASSSDSIPSSINASESSSLQQEMSSTQNTAHVNYDTTPYNTPHFSIQENGFIIQENTIFKAYLYSITGQKLSAITGSHSGTYYWNTSIDDGVYVIQCITPSGSQTQVFSIQ